MNKKTLKLIKGLSAVTAIALTSAVSSAAFAETTVNKLGNNAYVYTITAGCEDGSNININDILCDLGLSDNCSSIQLPAPDTNIPENTPEADDNNSNQDGNSGSDNGTQVQPPENNDGNAGNGSTENTVSAFEQQVVDLVNEVRAANGLSALTLNVELSKVARIKSQDMKDNNYFSHTSPTYGSPFDMMKDFGISYRTAGENIAKGQTTPEMVMNAWMNSEGHRANILNSAYTQIGVGYVAEGNYWTQMFIG